MTRILIIVLISALSIQAVAQSNCNNQKVIDSLMLIKFSTDLKKAVMTTDMTKIARFFKFPFLNSGCGLDDTLQDTIIDLKEFGVSKYGDFFGCWFMETISKGFISQTFETYQDGNNCKYLFKYPTCFSTKTSTCKTHIFSVEKINGEYLITSSWLSD